MRFLCCIILCPPLFTSKKDIFVERQKRVCKSVSLSITQEMNAEGSLCANKAVKQTLYS